MMERVFDKPLLEAGTLCLYRQPGSVKARLVRTHPWAGGSIGWSKGGRPLVYHRLMRTDPGVGPSPRVSDQFLTPVHADQPLTIAAAFVGQLSRDAAILKDAALLERQTPTLTGQIGVQITTPKRTPWRWEVLLDGHRVAATNNDWHAAALRDLAETLQRKAGQCEAQDQTHTNRVGTPMPE